MNNDHRFFTNKAGEDSLLDRFKNTLKDVAHFDLLVGYFRTSGFHLLQADLQPIPYIRILVGLNVDRQTFEVVEKQRAMDFASTQKTRDTFDKAVMAELAQAEDQYEVESGVKRFIQMLQSGQIQIKAHPSQNIHAKVYIQRFHEEDRDYGRVITGSSNFSYSGLQGKYEFNVELKDKQDVTFALEKFEELWAEGVDLSEQYVDTVTRRTWLNDQISPYQLYLKFLYEYFKEEINAEEEIDTILPKGFMKLAYQEDAVRTAHRILETYGGVFLADVVGLGKTFISALLAQQFGRAKILVICPPVLQEYWQETFRQFWVPAVTVESLGKLDRLIERGHQQYKYVFVDEAHRFRNERTQRYEKLYEICRGKKVILVSATPLNNRIDDIYAQLKLFQPTRKSQIPGIPNLDRFFQELNKRLRQYEKDDPHYVQEVKAVASEVRNKVLTHVMVRRTRHEIIANYQEDIQEQGLVFPDVAEPQRVIYEFDGQIESTFEKTITLLKQFHYARYTPRLYLRQELTPLETQSQKNVGSFMKLLLVKRLESSFHAFRQTLRRFIESYERFIEMYDNGRLLISSELDVYDLLERDDEAYIQRLIEAGDVDEFTPADFVPDFQPKLLADLHTLQAMEQAWLAVTTDPKREQLIQELRTNTLLNQNRVILFTESAETAVYLYDGLQAEFGKQVMAFTSGQAHHDGQTLGRQTAVDLIEANYDPRHHDPRDDVRLLITTDVLAEGINLHRAPIVINYDLPWNPTRVLQRMGRVNRVGTIHEWVYLFNFFPTTQSDAHLGLENNIIAKIQAFHDMLGEDARYLSEEEEVAQHNLNGRWQYQRLNNRQTYITEPDPEERSYLEYLQLIRHIRDQDPDLFEQIKRLPAKARAGWAHMGGEPVEPPATHFDKLNDRLESEGNFSPPVGGDVGAKVPTEGVDQLLTFFRLGRLKRFFLATEQEATEIGFFQAVDLLACDPDTPRAPIPKAYYELLADNKDRFQQSIEEQTSPAPTIGGGHTHAKQILKHCRAAQKDTQRLTDDDEAYLKQVTDAFAQGRIPQTVSKRVMDAIKKKKKQINSAVRLVQIFRKHLSPTLLLPEPEPQPTPAFSQREIILSAYRTHKDA